MDQGLFEESVFVGLLRTNLLFAYGETQPAVFDGTNRFDIFGKRHTSSAFSVIVRSEATREGISNFETADARHAAAEFRGRSVKSFCDVIAREGGCQ